MTRMNGWAGVPGTLAMRSIAPALLTALLAGTAGVAAAQGTIATDRPGLGFGATTVPVGAVQLELGVPGVASTSSAGGSARLINFPALLRVGVTPWAELRLGSPLLDFSHAVAAGQTENANGFGGLEIGAKLSWAPGAHAPVLAAIPSVILPVGDSRFVGDRSSYTLNGVAAWSLPDGFGLTTVAGIIRAPLGDAGHTTNGNLVAVLGRSLTTQLSGYVEAGDFPTSAGPAPAYVGGGVTFLAGRLVQLDTFVDRGVTDAASDWLFGLGASVRLGH